MKKPVLHQLKTKGSILDGMSYVIECGDGQIVVIDGAMPEDGEDLYLYLQKLTGKAVPEVAAWIMTHLHIDHDGALIDLGQRHAGDLIVKKFICRYPCQEMIAKREPAVLNELPLLEAALDAFGCERIVPTTGDRYTFGAVELEVLFTCAEFTDPEYRYNINDTSTVLRMTAEGQTVLFLGDSEPNANAIMIARHGKKLKSDVVQVAHHGESGSTAELYRLIDAEYVLWPVNVEATKLQMYAYNANRAIFESCKVKDTFIAGYGTRVLELPIHPDYAPYIVKVPDLQRELIPQHCMNRAETLPDLQNPTDPAWEQSPEINVCASYTGKRNGAYGRMRVLWSEDAIYLKVSYFKDPIVSDPNAFTVNSCNNVRLHMTECPSQDLSSGWNPVAQDPSFLRNLIIYPEQKKLPGGVGMNNLPERCSSFGFQEKDHYDICARVSFTLPHNEGDLIGFHMETNGVEEKGGCRTVKMMLCTEGVTEIYRLSPAGMLLWKLK